ncbi:endolytic transglycosylase MltG [Candidatus Aminicenantes bacterium AH-873-B07]|nr:endolytic transglycosylase MltG [Candidatus Aminicenantes bacterium AH-873-B07]
MKIFKLIILFAILLILFFIIWFYLGYYFPYKGENKSKIIEIKKGLHVKAIAEELRKEKIIRNSRAFLIGYKIFFKNKSLKAGEYLFSFPISSHQVLDKLIKGEILLHLITIPEGLIIEEIAAIYEKKIGILKQEFIKATKNTNLIKEIDSKAKDLEGYLFPETYHFPRKISANKIVETMILQFKKIFNNEWKKRALDLGMSIREVVILASLIEKETSIKEEKPLISAVFHNRLARGMKLECDPTIIYALKKEGKYKNKIRTKDKSFDSPYNTYVYYGLPPGPICNPGKDSLKAALFPAPVKYLYFVSKNDGTHYFSFNLKEHNKAVQKYQKTIKK